MIPWVSGNATVVRRPAINHRDGPPRNGPAAPHHGRPGWPPRPHHIPAQPHSLEPGYRTPAGAGVPTEGFVVTTKKGFNSMLQGFFIPPPTIAVDCRELPSTTWGRNMIPARPGRHHVRVHVQHPLLGRFGLAELIAQVPPGRFVELEYKPPLFWGQGLLGEGPQSQNVLKFVLIIAAIPLGILVLVFLIIAIVALLT